MNAKHLTTADFTAGEMKIKHPSLQTRPFLVMLSSPSCPHCTRAAPAFASLSQKHPAFVIQSPSQNPQEMALMKAVQEWITRGGKEFKGFPSYYKFYPNGHMEEYNGARDEASLVKFLI
jgi:thiol-disulfide isomerase/thioredoxin